MLAYFPTLYEDELLYSGIARYHLVSGNKTQRQTVEDLFGNRSVCATTDLPSHLLSLADNLNCKYTTDQIINNHTLFPYYTFFMNKKKIYQVRSLMENGSRQGKVHASLGLLASSIKMPSKLRFCTECYKTDSEICEPYWHRSHQLPGVIICPLHMSILKVSTVEYSTHHHKFSFVPLEMHSELNYTEPVIDTDWWDHLSFIAVQSDLLLQSQSKFKEWTTFYRSMRLMEKYQTVGNRIRFNRITHDFRNFYTDELLEYLNCDVDTNSSDTWLHKIIRDHEDITHPLRHLLLISFVEKSVDAFSVSNNSFPFRGGTWPCLNKAADHYNHSVVEQCIVTRCSRTSKPIGTFHCNCGFVYSRKGPDTCDEDMYRIGRIKAFGPVWYDKLRHLAKTNTSLRQKAKILGVDPRTVKTQMEHLDMNKAALHKTRRQGQITRSIRNSERLCSLTKIKRNVDWGQRDEILYDVVVKTVEQMKQLPNPQRISLASIVRHADSGNLKHKLMKNLNKLPKTNEFIKRHVDSTETYQIRRLTWAACRLHEVEGRVSGWRLLKLAGLNHPLRKDVKVKYMELLS